MKRRTMLAAALPISVTVAGCLDVVRSGSDDGGSDYVDASGDIEVRIDDEPLDLSADRFQAEHAEEDSLAFHLHEGDDHWYMEGREPVTFAEGIDLLPHFAYDHVDGEHVIEIDDRTYDGREGAEIGFFANEDPVDPTAYEPEDGDSLLVTISS